MLPISLLDKVLQWLFYTVTIVWAESALVVIDEWPSYRGGRISRFDCTYNKKLYLFLNFLDRVKHVTNKLIIITMEMKNII